MEGYSVDSVINTIEEASRIFDEEPNYIELPSDKELVFVGDTHGDHNATRYILSNFSDSNLVFLGDYVDRAETFLGSLENIMILLQAKINNPGLVLLRGNHEDKKVFTDYEFEEELYDFAQYDKAREITTRFQASFNKMPYVASADNGILALHGGLPNITRKSQLRNLPKDIDPGDHKIIHQILWNDNVISPEHLGDTGIRCSERIGELDELFEYGEPFFSKKMKILGKNVLLRGHDYTRKGYALDGRILTIFTCHRYDSSGLTKGSYVAIADPQKEYESAIHLKIHMLR